MLDAAAVQDEDDDTIPPEPARPAWVARTRSSSDHFNTLSPEWEFPFSV